MSSQPSSRNRSHPRTPCNNRHLPSFPNPLHRRRSQSKQQEQQQHVPPAPRPPPSSPVLTTSLLARLKIRTRETTQSIRLRAVPGAGGGGAGTCDATRIPLTERNVATFLAELRRDRDPEQNDDGDDGGDGREEAEEEEIDDIIVDGDRERQRRKEEILGLKAKSEKRVVKWLDGVG